MADRDSMDRGLTVPPQVLAVDLHDQAVILTEVLTLHPAHLAATELIREVTAGSADFESQDRYERALRDLRGAGLLQPFADLVLPTRAALHFDQLRGGD